MDVQLDLSMRTAGILQGWSLTDYQSLTGTSGIRMTRDAGARALSQNEIKR